MKYILHQSDSRSSSVHVSFPKSQSSALEDGGTRGHLQRVLYGHFRRRALAHLAHRASMCDLSPFQAHASCHDGPYSCDRIRLDSRTRSYGKPPRYHSSPRLDNVLMDGIICSAWAKCCGRNDISPLEITHCSVLFVYDWLLHHT
jgi:hypothetical protein